MGALLLPGPLTLQFLVAVRASLRSQEASSRSSSSRSSPQLQQFSAIKPACWNWSAANRWKSAESSSEGDRRLFQDGSMHRALLSLPFPRLATNISCQVFAGSEITAWPLQKLQMEMKWTKSEGNAASLVPAALHVGPLSGRFLMQFSSSWTERCGKLNCEISDFHSAKFHFTLNYF